MRTSGQTYTALRRQANRLAKKLGIEFTAAFDLVAQKHGYRDSEHAIHWLIRMEWWGPCDPPATPTRPAAAPTK